MYILYPVFFFTGIVLAAMFLAKAVSIVLASPFRYPVFRYDFDVTGKRNPDFDDCIDMFLIQGGFSQVASHQQVIREWEEENRKKVEKAVFKKLRSRQLKEALQCEHDYHFVMSRVKKKYRQVRYVKSAYYEPVEVKHCLTDFDFLQNRYEELRRIGFETTLNRYHSKSQRKLMTPQLRKLVKERDRYTCQICGKVRLDDTGIHIDHIFPVSKGGKSVLSNLQVLCAECNQRKGAKVLSAESGRLQSGSDQPLRTLPLS